MTTTTTPMPTPTPLQGIKVVELAHWLAGRVIRGKQEGGRAIGEVHRPGAREEASARDNEARAAAVAAHGSIIDKACVIAGQIESEGFASLGCREELDRSSSGS